MKKLLLSIIILLAMAGQGWATNYFGCQTSQAVDGDNTWCVYSALADGDPTTSAACTKSADGEYTAWSTIAAEGASAVLYANGCALTIAADDAITVGKLSTRDAGTGAYDYAGGSFTVTAGTPGPTITADMEAGTTDCLVTAGSGTVTVVGDSVGSDGTSSKSGILNAAQTLVFTGTATGGATGSLSCGIFKSSATGNVTIKGDVIGGAAGAGLYVQYGATVDITGNVTGGSSTSTCHGVNNSSSSSTVTITGDVTAGACDGCAGVFNTGAGTVTVTGGNLIYVNAPSFPISGKVVYDPDADNYIQFVAGTDVYLSQAPSKAKVLTDTSVVVSTTGAYEVGTATTGGGGGAWGF